MTADPAGAARPESGGPEADQPEEAGPQGHCPSCGRPVAPGHAFCEACGATLAPPSARDHEELDLGLLAGVTDRGLRHPRNEDAMALDTVGTAAARVAVAVVCDGVSSAPRPDEASLAAAQAAIRALRTAADLSADPAGASLAAVHAAWEGLTGLAGPSGSPSATYVSAVIGRDAVTVCWLGDSRVYWLAADDSSQRLTEDDSLAEEMVAAGVLSRDKAMASPQAHVITRWLGANAAEPDPHVARFEPSGPGVVLVCSDGLWNYLPEAADLAKLALPTGLTDPLGAARALVKFAIDAGGTDNITAVLAPVPPGEIAD
jgi:serine/threonine protein phosphatase PrpC